MQKSLKEILEGIEYKLSGGSDDAIIGDIRIDSREVEEGDVFICLVGGEYNGNEFAYEAMLRGCAAIVTEGAYYMGVPTITVDNARLAYEMICRNYYERVDTKMTIIAVTGTNGKTTTANIISKLLSTDEKVGLIGTTGYYADGELLGEGLTTPDPHILYRLLWEMHAIGITTIVMEASAHAIFLQKLTHLSIDYAIFTNCTRDHLDFFRTQENYENAKLNLLNRKDIPTVIINADDKLSRKVKRKKSTVYTYGISSPSDVFPYSYTETEQGMSFVLNVLDELVELDTALFGEFNLYNLLAASTVAYLMGIELEAIKQRVQSLSPVNGRCNLIRAHDRRIIIDYAHTPDGVENIINCIKKSSRNRIITVFGCGGNRDRGKRPKMAECASKLSDITIVTTDNPRFENPQDIIDEVVQGIVDGAEFYTEVDRTKAIAKAYELSREGDDILILGKGAESYMEIEGVKHEYSDFNVVAEVFK